MGHECDASMSGLAVDPRRSRRAVLAILILALPGMAAATEPLFTCRVGPTIASGLRAGGANQAVVLRGDNPVVAYYNLPEPKQETLFPEDAGLYLYTCDDAECTSGTTRQVAVSTATHSVDLSMVLQGDDQHAVIATHNRDTATPGVRLYHCTDRTCTQPRVQRLSTGQQLTPNLTLSPDERPFVVFGSHWPDNIHPIELSTCRCQDAPCTVPPTCNPIVDQEDNGWYPTTLWRDNQPALIAHAGDGPAAVLQCTNADCSAGINHPISGMPPNYGSGYTAIGLGVNGRAFVAYAAFRNNNAGAPMLSVCADDNCTGETSRALDIERPLRIVRLVVRPNGRAVVTWGEEALPGAALRFYQCADRACSDGRVGTVVSRPEVGHSVAMRRDGVAVVAFRPLAAGTVALAFCGLPTDLIFTDDFDPL